MTPPLSSLLWFLVVIAAIPLALWFVKRSPVGSGGRGITRSISVLPLSASQRIVTVEVGQGEQRCWLVLGVTAHQISTLYTMLPQDEAPPVVPNPTTTFAQLITRLRGDHDAH